MLPAGARKVETRETKKGRDRHSPDRDLFRVTNLRPDCDWEEVAGRKTHIEQRCALPLPTRAYP
jgi:hypothetical protein